MRMQQMSSVTNGGHCTVRLRDTLAVNENPALDDSADLAECGDVFRRIAIDDENVSALAHGDR